MKKNLILLISTILVLVLVLEIFINFFFPQDLQRYWVYNEKSHGLSINKKNYTHKLHRFNSFRAKYTFGEYHNRITKINKNTKNKPKILVLGDSFTFGWLVKDEDTYIHKFQKNHLDYDFINVSVGAWGSSQYTLFSELFCKQINPVKIFVFLNSDDSHRGYKLKFYQIKNGILLKTKIDFIDIQKESNFDKKIPFYKFLKSNSHLFMLTRNVVYNLFNKPSYNPWSIDKYWPRPNIKFDEEYSKKVLVYNKKIFLKLNQIADKCGSKLYIFNLMWANPTMLADENPNKLFLQSAKSFFKDNEIEYFENSKAMEKLYKNPIQYLIDIDFHPNKNGTDLIYNSLKDYVGSVLTN